MNFIFVFSLWNTFRPCCSSNLSPDTHTHQHTVTHKNVYYSHAVQSRRETDLSSAARSSSVSFLRRSVSANSFSIASRSCFTLCHTNTINVCVFTNTGEQSRAIVAHAVSDDHNMHR
jgi:hypothetical protein